MRYEPEKNIFVSHIIRFSSATTKLGCIRGVSSDIERLGEWSSPKYRLHSW